MPSIDNYDSRPLPFSTSNPTLLKKIKVLHPHCTPSHARLRILGSIWRRSYFPGSHKAEKRGVPDGHRSRIGKRNDECLQGTLVGRYTLRDNATRKLYCRMLLTYMRSRSRTISIDGAYRS